MVTRWLRATFFFAGTLSAFYETCSRLDEPIGFSYLLSLFFSYIFSRACCFFLSRALYSLHCNFAVFIYRFYHAF